jgi:molybdopterin-containing oxidoreductase family membrane subunit
MAVFIVPVGVGVHTITSWLLATTVQPGWHSTVFGPYFVVTAVFSGISALFIAMTIVRRVLHLEDYITLKQYHGLSWLYITMAIVWGYFTYTETLTLVAGQQLMEFPVLASKLWGEFAPHFWFMIIMIGSGFIMMVFAQILPAVLSRLYILQPTRVLAVATFGGLLLLFLTDERFATIGKGQETINLRAFGWGIVILCVLIVIAGIGALIKRHFVISAFVAGVFVIIGTWTERWLIIVPTLTHPRMIAWNSYIPTFTEIGLTIASIALFILLFMLFFKLFPAVPIWETAEGRIVDEAHEQVVIPVPEPSHRIFKKHRWTFH